MLLLVPLGWAEDNGVSLAPSYSAASVVNAASNEWGALAPNTIATLYGSNLSWSTRSVTPEEIRNGRLPTVLAGTGVRIFLNNIPAHVYYVSPAQINFLVPNDLLPGPVGIRVVRDGLAGPEVNLRLREAAPALFLLAAGTAVMVRDDGTVASAASPAKPGGIVVLYATGLGATIPSFARGEVPRVAAEIRRRAEFQVLLDHAAVADADILYVGVAPGFAGLYQINLRLPDWVGSNPEVELLLGGEISPPGIRLPVD